MKSPQRYVRRSIPFVTACELEAGDGPVYDRLGRLLGDWVPGDMLVHTPWDTFTARRALFERMYRTVEETVPDAGTVHVDSGG